MTSLKSMMAAPRMVFAVIFLQAFTFTVAAAEDKPVVPMGALAHAARALEESTSGKILEVRLSDAPGDAVFEAAVKKPEGNGILYLKIVSPTDEITAIAVSELAPWMVNYPLEAYMRSVDKAKVPLERAIVQAEKRANAPAVAAGVAKPLSGSNTVLAWFVETDKGKKRELLAIDAESGARITNPDALYERRTPVMLARRLAAAAP